MPIDTANGSSATVLSNPWKKPEVTATSSSFQELMDSDLAAKLQKEEEEKYARGISPSVTIPSHDEQFQSESYEGSQDDNDHLLALMLQHEFNNEFNGMMKNYETAINRHSKVKLSMKNFMLLPAAGTDPSHVEEPFDELQETNSDCERDEPMPTFNRRGISGKGAALVTKHNAELCGKRNVARVMNTFPPEFDTGNVLNKMHLSNKVFNQLKLHSYAEEKRMNRLHDKEDKSTTSLAFDPKTRILLYKALNSCILDEIGSIIATGKESIVLYGKGGQNEERKMPEEVAIKIFKTTLNEYHTREKYLREDFRFKNRYKSLNSRKMVKLWAEKEMFNLQRLQRVGIPCPEPVLLKKHVLFLSFIGKDSVPAQRLRDAILSPDELANAYQQCLNILKKIYHECKLIHADFSEYNLLWFDNTVYVIDVAQSVEPYHPNAYTYLLRDCTNLSTYFTRRSLNEMVLSPEDTFNYVTGLAFDQKGEEFLNQVQAYEKNIRLQSEAVKEKENFSFDYFFNQMRQFHDPNSSDDDDEDEDDGDEDYVDLTSDDETIKKKISTQKMKSAKH